MTKPRDIWHDRYKPRSTFNIGAPSQKGYKRKELYCTDDEFIKLMLMLDKMRKGV